MNKQRRKELEKAIELLQQAGFIISAVRDEEQGAFDNLSEGLQQSEQGQRLEENVSTLDDQESELEGVISRLEEVVTN